MSVTRRYKKSRPDSVAAFGVIDLLRARLTSQSDQGEPRSHAEYLPEMRAKQAAGRLANPATAMLLDRLEWSIARSAAPPPVLVTRPQPPHTAAPEPEPEPFTMPSYPTATAAVADEHAWRKNLSRRR